ncbi:hypothetical protein EDD22DRAFT_849785 [Suillus occidentalis]|nr:hypothetical protein EDD22DRAFT_849785 [Suillus occidentalis]
MFDSITTGAVILHISHGHEVKENDDPFIELAGHVLYQWLHTTAPGAFMADVIPFLVKIPKWFPGAGFNTLLADEEDDMKWSTATLYGGASKTVTKVELQEQMEMNKKLMQGLNEMWKQHMSQTQEVQKEQEQAPGKLGLMVKKNLVGVHIPKKVRMGHEAQ